MCETSLRLYKAVRQFKRWIVQWPHRVEETFNGPSTEKTIVPVGFEHDQFRWYAPAVIHSGPRRMAGPCTGRKPLRCFFGT